MPMLSRMRGRRRALPHPVLPHTEAWFRFNHSTPTGGPDRRWSWSSILRTPRRSCRSPARPTLIALRGPLELEVFLDGHSLGRRSVGSNSEFDLDVEHRGGSAGALRTARRGQHLHGAARSVREPGLPAAFVSSDNRLHQLSLHMQQSRSMPLARSTASAQRDLHEAVECVVANGPGDPLERATDRAKRLGQRAVIVRVAGEHHAIVGQDPRSQEFLKV